MNRAVVPVDLPNQLGPTQPGQLNCSIRLSLPTNQNCEAVVITGREFWVADNGVVEAHEAGHLVSTAAVKALRKVVPCPIEGGIEMPREAEGIDLLPAESGSEHVRLSHQVRAEHSAVIVADLEYVVGERVIPAVWKLRVILPADVALVAGRVPEADGVTGEGRGEQKP